MKSCRPVWLALVVSMSLPQALAQELRELRSEVGLWGSIESVHDIDGDGIRDIAVGAEDAVRAGIQSGRVAVLSGRTGELLWEDWGDRYGQDYGMELDALGDVDGDGRDELVFGEDRAIHVVSSVNGTRWYSWERPELLLEGIESGGHADGDGVPDFAVVWRDHPYDWEIVLHSGATLEPIRTFVLKESQRTELAWAADVSGDGISELLVSHWPTVQKALTVNLIHGRSGESLKEWSGEERSDYFGSEIAAVGDLDADGVGDFAIAAIRSNTETRQSFVDVFSGATLKPLFRVVGDSRLRDFGGTLEPVGDFDGDGYEDLAIGAPGGSDGSILIVGGPDGHELEFIRGRVGVGPMTGQFGRWIATLGDVNWNGSPELAVVERGYDEGGSPDIGRIVLLSGGCGSAEVYGTGCPTSPLLTGGNSCASPGGMLDLRISRGFGGAHGILLFSLSGRGESPMWGCELYLAPPVFTGPDFTLAGLPGIPGMGTFELRSVLPGAQWLLGRHLCFQAIVSDPEGVRGVAFTNGLELIIQ